MSAAVIHPAEQFPEPGSLDLRLLAEDGQSVHLFQRGGPFVVELVGPVGGKDQDGSLLVISLAFKRRWQAERATKILSDVIEHVNALVAEEPPPCEHKKLALTRFSRVLEQEVVCDECGAGAEVSFAAEGSDRTTLT